MTNAAAFKPERWLKVAQGGFEGKLHPFASLPYGYGARMCLGRRFADLEMQILLAKVKRKHTQLSQTFTLQFVFFTNFFQLLRNYKLEFNHEPLKYAVTFMYAPEGPLQFKMTKA